jgi:hypothetical protein
MRSLALHAFRSPNSRIRNLRCCADRTQLLNACFNSTKCRPHQMLCRPHLNVVQTALNAVQTAVAQRLHYKSTQHAPETATAAQAARAIVPVRRSRGEGVASAGNKRVRRFLGGCANCRLCRAAGMAYCGDGAGMVYCGSGVLWGWCTAEVVYCGSGVVHKDAGAILRGEEI